MLTDVVISKIYFLAKQHYGNNWEDVAHDAFLSLLRWPPNVDLNTVRMVYLKDVVRKSARKLYRDLYFVDSDTHIQVTTENPEVTLVTLEDLNDIWRKIERLPKKKLAAIKTMYYDEVNLTRSQWVLVSQARQILKKHLTPIDFSVNIYTINSNEDV